MREDITLSRRLHLPPSWTILLSVAAGAAAVAWRLISHQASGDTWFPLRALIWPGSAVVAAVYSFAWLGWALDID